MYWILTLVDTKGTGLWWFTMDSNGNKIGLALSGGGYRAAAYHVGTIRALRYLGILDKVDVISSVSGGSITSAYYLLNKKGYRRFLKNFNRKLHFGVMHLAITNIALFIIFTFTMGMMFGFGWTWLAIPVFWFLNFKLLPLSKWIMLQYDYLFFHKKTLSDFPDLPHVIINTTDVAHASLFKFSKDRAWGYTYRNYNAKEDCITGKKFPVSMAVMASSCVPFAFNPIRIPEKFRKDKSCVLPLLVDGGLYDNQGVHVISEKTSKDYFTKYAIVSNAGNTELNDKRIWNIFLLLMKTSDILMKRIEKFQAQKIMFSTDNIERRYAYVSLTWDTNDRLVKSFIYNIAKGLVPDEVYLAHGINETDARDIREYYQLHGKHKNETIDKITSIVKNSIDWQTLEHLRPNKKESMTAKSVCTNLIGLRRNQIYCLQKFSEWMTIVQVRLYLPNLLNN